MIPLAYYISAPENSAVNDVVEPAGAVASHPVVGVGGVVICDGRVVLVRRAQEPRKGQWSLPGGRLELGESLREGVRRELREETGLDVQVGELIEAFERFYRAPDGQLAFHFVILDYLCWPVGGALRAGGDVTEVALAAEDELDRYALSPKAREVITKAFAMARAAHR